MFCYSIYIQGSHIKSSADSREYYPPIYYNHWVFKHFLACREENLPYSTPSDALCVNAIREQTIVAKKA